MSEPLKAIETTYKGYRFRSRLEARWAVFFDALGVEWDYEPEGFDLDGTPYLPDFWLKTVSMWGEVKPGPFTPEELRKARLLADASGHPVLRLIGVPAYRAYWAASPPAWGYPPDDGGGHGGEMDYLLDDLYTESEHRFFMSPGLDEGEVLDADDRDCYPSDRTRAAYAAARAARFEHGESGAAGHPPGSTRSWGRQARRAEALARIRIPTTPEPWHAVAMRALTEQLGAPLAVRERMKPRWGIGARLPQSEAEALAILADLARFAAEAGQ